MRKYREGKAPGAAQRGVVATVREMLIQIQSLGKLEKTAEV